MCALNGELLNENQVVCCRAGRLYNKESLIKLLLDRKKQRLSNNDSDPCPHVKSIKDVVHVRFTSSDKRWICPVTKEELRNGVVTKFYCISKCGHTLSDKALQFTLKQQQQQQQQDDDDDDTHECVECGISFNEKSDLIWLNPSDEIIKQRILSEQKKSSINKKKKRDDSDSMQKKIKT